METGSLIEAALRQRIEILERELAESNSHRARLTGDIKLAMSQGYDTNVDERDLYTRYEIDLVHNAFSAGFDAGANGSGTQSVKYKRREIYIKKLTKDGELI